ncbi:MAG TPA: SDR family NAD(P)-dependent oxidoreductase [Actinomycetes bacterium]
MIALVTGASSGIGAATARRLAREPGARLVLVARRRERLQALAEELGGATVVAVDLTDPGAPATVAERVEREHGRLDLLVNNAGNSGSGAFDKSGSAGVLATMALNFGAQVRLTEALLPLLRRSAPSAIVNVASVAGRISMPYRGDYSASKSALIAWTDSIRPEQRRHGVHVGLVLPGFVATEGFPQRELLERRATRWLVSRDDKVADAIVDTALRRRPERYVPRPYAVFPVLRILVPPLYRRVMGGGRFSPTPVSRARGGGPR